MLVAFTLSFYVRERGLEPPRLAPPVPKTGVFTNYTTRAFYRVRPVGHLPLHGQYTFRISSDDYIFTNILKVFDP